VAQRRTVDLLLTVSARFGGKAVNLVVFLVLAHTLSLPELGLYGFVFATVLVMSTAFDVGVRNSLGYLIGKNPEDGPTLIKQSFVLWAVFSIGSVASLYFIFQFSAADLESIDYFVPSALFAVSSLFLRMMQGALLGEGRIKFYNQTELMSRVVLAIGTFWLFATHGISLTSSLWMLGLSQAAAAILLAWGFVGSMSGGVLGNYPLLRQLLGRGFLFMIGVLLMHASKRFAFLILSQMSPVAEVGYFFGLQRLSEILTEVGLAVAVVVFSHNVRAASKSEAVETAAFSMRVSFLFLFLISIVLFAFSDFLVPLALGKEFAGDTTLFRVVLVASLLGSIWTILYPSLSAITSPMTSFWIFLPNVMVNCVSVWVLYQMFGIMGAAYSLLIVNTTLSISFLIAFNRLYGAPIASFLLLRKGDLSVPKIAKLAKFLPFRRRNSKGEV